MEKNVWLEAVRRGTVLRPTEGRERRHGRNAARTRMQQEKACKSDRRPVVEWVRGDKRGTAGDARSAVQHTSDQQPCASGAGRGQATLPRMRA